MNNPTDRKDRGYLKSKFKDGDRPDQQDFAAWIDSSINMESDRVFTENGKMGIGTSNPKNPLEINGFNPNDGVKTSLLTTDGTNSSFRIAHPDTGQVALGVEKNQAVQIGQFLNQGTSFDSNLVIDGSGKVGIHTSEPNAELTVAGTASISEKLILGNAIIEADQTTLYVTLDGVKYKIPLKSGSTIKPVYWALIGAGVLLLIIILVSIIVTLIGGKG